MALSPLRKLPSLLPMPLVTEKSCEVRMNQQVATNDGEHLGPEVQAGIAHVGTLVRKSVTAIIDQGILS